MRTRIRVYIIYNTITIPQGEQTAGNCFLLIPPPLRSSSYLRRTAPSGGSRILERKQSAWNCFLLIPPPLRSSSYLRRTAPSGGSRNLERKQSGRNSSPKVGEVPEGRRGMKHNLRDMKQNSLIPAILLKKDKALRCKR